MSALRAWLRDADLAAWRVLHGEWRAAWLDALMPFLRNPFFWAPLYLFFLVFMLRGHGRRGLVWCLGYVAAFGLCDFISASIIKPAVRRTRPCNDGALTDLLNIIVPCGSGYSFPSSHATNHFGMAAFIFFTCAAIWPRGRWLAWLWAALVAYAQVYVGVHFPLDVLCGGLLGVLIGGFLAWAFNRYAGLRRPATAASAPRTGYP